MFCLFSEFPVQQKWPKNKSSQNALKKFSRFFSEYFWIFGANNTRGRCTRWAQPTWERQDPQTRPGGLWSLRGPLTYPFTPHHHLPPEKILHCSISCILALKPTDFDLFARSSVFETVSGDCCLVCDSSIGPISFCSSALFIANFCCLGDPVLELACQIYMVPSSSNAWYRL